ncbi:MAG: hypothetical protein KY410_06955, partial [Proteobacteria bacterium]|nr:hypothetical protein [Pseudomonadota bacterium]
MSQPPRPVVLAILDGWGYSETSEYNAIHAANTPNWDRLWADNPHASIDTSGISVGLPSGQMGNSEVGHLNLGAGRVIYQDVTRISKAIDDGEFAGNPQLTEAVDAAKRSGGVVHVIGLLSPGGVHALDEHMFAMVRLAADRGATVCVHALLDGRDMPPRSARESLERMNAVCEQTGRARIVSLVGRYFAMDRDQRWDRVERAWRAIVDGQSEHRADGEDGGEEAEDAEHQRADAQPVAGPGGGGVAVPARLAAGAAGPAAARRAERGAAAGAGGRGVRVLGSGHAAV